MTYRLSPLAEQDLEEIWLYVAEERARPAPIDSPTRSSISSSGSPSAHGGRIRPEFGAGVRSSVVEPYVIYYRDEAELLIARVLHGHRDQAAAWSD